MLIRKIDYIDDNIINNLMAAIVICFSLINGAIGIKNISYFTTGVILILFFLGLIKKKTFIYFRPLLIILFVLSTFLCSLILVPNNEYTLMYLLKFLSMGIVSLLIGRQKLSIENVIFYIEIIGTICTSVYLVRTLEQYHASLQMGITYSMLPVFYASCIELLYIKRHKLMSLFLFITLFYMFVQYATRGLWLVLVISILIYIYILLGRSGKGKSQILIYGITVTIMFVGIMFVIQNFVNVLYVISDLLYLVTGNRVYAIDKAIYLINSGNVGNGRDDLIMMASDVIEGNLFFGRGIGYFETISNGIYVHNLFYQGLCEAGVFFLIPLLMILFNVIKQLLTKKESMVSIFFFLLLVANGVIMLFFSSVYWQNFLFWFLIGYMIRPSYINE